MVFTKAFDLQVSDYYSYYILITIFKEKYQQKEDFFSTTPNTTNNTKYSLYYIQLFSSLLQI